MKNIIIILSIVFFSCSNVNEEQKKIEYDNISANIPKAFFFATNNLNGSSLRSYDVTSSNPDSIEQRMLSYLTAIYGVEFSQMYFENKTECTPDLSKYLYFSQSLGEDLNANNANQFISTTFISARTQLRSTISDGNLQLKVDKLVSQIEDTVQSYAKHALEIESYSEIELKNILLATIHNFKVNESMDDLTSEEKDKFSTIILTLESSLDGFLNYSSTISTSTPNSIAQFGFRSTKDWFSSFTKQLVSFVVVAVCMVAGAVVGAVVGYVITGANPVGVGLGAVAGIVAGVKASDLIREALLD